VVEKFEIINFKTEVVLGAIKDELSFSRFSGHPH
jgi:hypothetical protein